MYTCTGLGFQVRENQNFLAGGGHQDPLFWAGESTRGHRVPPPSCHSGVIFKTAHKMQCAHTLDRGRLSGKACAQTKRHYRGQQLGPAGPVPRPSGPHARRLATAVEWLRSAHGQPPPHRPWHPCSEQEGDEGHLCPQHTCEGALVWRL